MDVKQPNINAPFNFGFGKQPVTSAPTSAPEPEPKPEPTPAPEELNVWSPSDDQPLAFSAILQLDGDCDGATTWDGQGFNGRDTRFGKDIARVIRMGYTLTPGQIETIYTILPTYRNTQLAHFNLYWDEMEKQKATLLKEAEDYAREKQRKLEATVIDDDAEAVRLFMLIDASECTRDEDFISSLQSGYQRYDSFTQKQMYWVKKLVERHFDRIDHTAQPVVQHAEAVNVGYTGEPDNGNEPEAGEVTISSLSDGNEPKQIAIADKPQIEQPLLPQAVPANPFAGISNPKPVHNVVPEEQSRTDAVPETDTAHGFIEDTNEPRETKTGDQSLQSAPVPTSPFAFTQTLADPVATLEKLHHTDVALDVDSVISFQRGGETLEIILDNTQKDAVEGVLKQRYSGITGAAGTGKTTVTRVVVQYLEKTSSFTPIDIANYGNTDTSTHVVAKRVPGIAFAAYTGRAMQQMKKALPEIYHDRCFTIHKLLGFHPEFFEDFDQEKDEWVMKRRFVPTYTEVVKMPWDCVVLDEGSMIPGPLWEQFLAACKEDCRIIMIGDINQLPPIHGRSVMGFAMLKWPFYELTHIHRQEGVDNPIVENAWRILRGEYPQKYEGTFDMIRVDKRKSSAVETLYKLVKILHQKKQFHPDGTDEKSGDIIIMGQNKDVLGQVSVNEHLTPYFNPPPKDETDPVGRRTLIISGYEKRFIAIGDKMMTTVNDHDAGTTNGMMGIVTDIVENGRYQDRTGALLSQGQINSLMLDMESMNIDTLDEHFQEGVEEENEDYQKRAASHIITVDFGQHDDGKRHQVPFETVGQVNNLVHAYAATCHKCQGSEFDTVIVVVHSSTHRLMFREWLYTAVTRAAKRVVLLYDDKGLAMAVNRQRIKGRNLEEKAHSFQQLMKLEDELGNLKTNVVIPTLPEPEKIEQ